MSKKPYNSIFVNGQHWNWHKIDPAEAQKWEKLDEQVQALERQIHDLEMAKSHCVSRTRQKYANNYVDGG